MWTIAAATHRSWAPRCCQCFGIPPPHIGVLQCPSRRHRLQFHTVCGDLDCRPHACVASIVYCCGLELVAQRMVTGIQVPHTPCVLRTHTPIKYDACMSCGVTHRHSGECGLPSFPHMLFVIGVPAPIHSSSDTVAVAAHARGHLPIYTITSPRGSTNTHTRTRGITSH